MARKKEWPPICLLGMNPKQVAAEIGRFIVHQVRRAGMTGCVVGLSGGVDSTVAAALAVRAFRRTKLEVVGYVLPAVTNSPEECRVAHDVARRLGITCTAFSISSIMNAFTCILPIGDTDVVFHKGNLASRVRGNVLSTMAAVEHKLVLGTGNRDEDFGLGYYTLFGDGAVHLSPLGQLPKRLVRQMACFLGFEDIARRVPTAGLEPGQTDFKDLGYSYATAELILEAEQAFASDWERHPQIVASAAKDFAAGSKFTTVKEIITDVRRRHQVASAKTEILHPPMPTVTLHWEEPKS